MLAVSFLTPVRSSEGATLRLLGKGDEAGSKNTLLGMTAFALARLSLDFEFVKEHGPPRLAREVRFAPAPAGEAIP